MKTRSGYYEDLTLGQKMGWLGRLSKAGFTAEMIRGMNAAPGNKMAEAMVSAVKLGPLAVASTRPIARRSRNAAADLGQLRDDELASFRSRLIDAGCGLDMLQKLMSEHDGMVARAMRQALERFPRSTLIQGVFVGPREQIKKMREWNLAYRWGIPDAEFEAAEAAIPSWPNKNLVAVVLVPYLAGEQEGRGLNGLQRTFKALCRCISERFTLRVFADLPGGAPGEMTVKKLVPMLHHRSGWKYKYQTGLRWEVIELACPLPFSANKILGKRSPHAGILAAAALHPEWLGNMREEYYDIPPVWLPGYRASPGYAPVLEMSASDEALLCIKWSAGRLDVALPSFYDDKPLILAC